MFAYLARRLAFALFLVFAVSSASLVLARLAPGDFAAESLGLGVQRETLEAARERYGLNRSIGAQYRAWIAGAARLDFGQSLLFDRPVADLIPERAANTAILAITALAAATLIGLPLGVVTGSRRRGFLTGLIKAASLLMLSMPPLLTSLFLVFAAARTGWLPVGGMTSASPDGGGLLRHLIVPAAALALPLAAMFERLQSQSMAEVMGQPYMLATRARGVPLSRAVWRDALKGALAPIAAVYGLVIGTLLSGSFAVEAITAWPGLGQLMLDGAARARRVPRRRLRRGRLRLPRDRHARVRRGGGGDRAAAAVRLEVENARLRPRPARRSRRGRDRRAGAGAVRGRPSVPRPVQRAADGPAPRGRCGRVACAVRLPVDARRASWSSATSRTGRSACRCAWFADGRLVASSDAARMPLLLLGSDSYGRDVFSRLLYGARISLGLSLTAARGRAPLRRARRRDRRLRGRAGRRSADAHLGLRHRPAGDVRRAGAARRCSARAPAVRSVRAPHRHLRRRRRAVRRARRPRDRAIGKAARLRRSRRSRSARATRACWCGTCCRRRAASSPSRS